MARHHLDAQAYEWLSNTLTTPFKATKHIHSHQDEVYKIETEAGNYYLKVSKTLQAEYDNLKKLENVLVTPRVIDFQNAGEQDHLLISELPGKNLVELIEDWPADKIVQKFADAIRGLHSINVASVFPKAKPNDVLLHGDMALPNIIISDEGNIGYIDFGQLSFGSPELDLADAIWSLQRNLGHGYGKSFLEQYGPVTMTPKIEEVLRYRHTS